MQPTPPMIYLCYPRFAGAWKEQNRVHGQISSQFTRGCVKTDFVYLRTNLKRDSHNFIAKICLFAKLANFTYLCQVLATFGSIIQDSFPHKKDLGSAAQGEKEMFGNNFLPPFFSMFVSISSQVHNFFDSYLPTLYI